MKTSKKMQLKIIDKIRENIVDGRPPFTGVEYYSDLADKWFEKGELTKYSFEVCELRVTPDTITINGVEIPKPLDIIEIDVSENYYFPQCHEKMYGIVKGDTVLEHNVFLPYRTEEEAIEASKKLFGIKD